jgi:hypothetical protein
MWFHEDEYGCDFVGCVQLKQFRASLRRLAHMGEVRAKPGTPLPEDWKDAGRGVDGGSLLPSYESRQVSGRVRIWFKFHQADDCSDARTEYLLDELERRESEQ